MFGKRHGNGNSQHLVRGRRNDIGPAITSCYVYNVVATIRFLKPAGPPSGTSRLLDELKTCFDSESLNKFYAMVAFAKVAPLVKLEEHIKRWKAAKKQLNGIFGVDHLGTSVQALEFVLHYFDEAAIAHTDQPVTFHPKFYIFEGKDRAVVFCGSQNCTVGGLETNWEGGIKIELTLPADGDLFRQAKECWSELTPHLIRLTDASLVELQRQNLLLDETKVATRFGSGGRGGKAPVTSPKTLVIFPKPLLRPPSPLPRSLFSVKSKSKKKLPAPTTRTQRIHSFVPQAFLTQIRPHHNGEVFLSVTAAKQVPEFFAWPFKGSTTPKKASNPPYPQRVPDPVADLVIYAPSGSPAWSATHINLNTVYYASKSEIRMTMPLEVFKQAPDGSIMVMRIPEEDEGLDYKIEIYPPTSPQYPLYLAVCNIPLPGGGKTPRHIGWF
jgi:HKD family nuclease